MSRLKSQLLLFTVTVFLSVPVIFITQEGMDAGARVALEGSQSKGDNVYDDKESVIASDQALETTAQVAGIIVATSTVIGLLITGVWSIMKMLLTQSEYKSSASNATSLGVLGDKIECELKEVKNLLLSSRLRESEHYHEQNELIGKLTTRVSMIERNNRRLDDVEHFLAVKCQYGKRHGSKEEEEEMGHSFSPYRESP